MGLIRLVFRTLFFVIALMAYFLVSFTIFAFAGFSFERARPFLTKVISITSRVGLKIFNVKVRKNFSPVDLNDNYLIVSIIFHI